MVALASRMQDNMEQHLQPIVKDANLSATEKLQRAMATFCAGKSPKMPKH